MTAPDPTAGEGCGHRGYPYCDGKRPCACPCHDASPPAVAASTGTSEDVEALAKLLCATDPTSNEDTWLVVREGHREYRRDHAAAVLASDWLAAHDAATADRVRRETAEGIADALERQKGIAEASRDIIETPLPKNNLGQQAWAYGDAARIAREQAR